MLVSAAFVIPKNGKDVHQEQMDRMNYGIFTQWIHYGNKDGQTTSILPNIYQSQECNAKPDTEVCQCSDSIYIKFKRVENEGLLFKVRMLVILGQNGVVVTRKYTGGSSGAGLFCTHGIFTLGKYTMLHSMSSFFCMSAIVY